MKTLKTQKVNPKMTELSDASKLVLQSLLKNVEGKTFEGDNVWGMVYLANVQVVSRRSLPGHLSALKEQNFYRPVDGCFGEVLMNVK